MSIAAKCPKCNSIGCSGNNFLCNNWTKEEKQEWTLKNTTSPTSSGEPYLSGIVGICSGCRQAFGACQCNKYSQSTTHNTSSPQEEKTKTQPLTKELFLESLNKLKLQEEHDDKCIKAFAVLMPDSHVSGYNNSFLREGLLNVLKIALNDNHRYSWIEYFIYDLNFGAKYHEGCANNADGSNIDLSSAEKLWELLVEENKK